MNQEQNELRKCSRCHSELHAQYFDYNRKLKLFKACNNCRKKPGWYYDCKCGSRFICTNTNIDRHERTNVHKYWETSKEILEKNKGIQGKF